MMWLPTITGWQKMVRGLWKISVKTGTEETGEAATGKMTEEVRNRWVPGRTEIITMTKEAPKTEWVLKTGTITRGPA